MAQTGPSLECTSGKPWRQHPAEATLMGQVHALWPLILISPLLMRRLPLPNGSMIMLLHTTYYLSISLTLLWSALAILTPLLCVG